jgi:hypothetical protein
MDLDSDQYKLSQFSDRKQIERTGLWWVTTIVIGVFLGNLMSFGAYQLYLKWELQQLAIALHDDTEAQFEHLKSEARRKAEINEALRKEQESRNAVNSKLAQTCQFWTNQVAKENTAQNRAYRDTACARAAGSIY